MPERSGRGLRLRLGLAALLSGALAACAARPAGFHTGLETLDEGGFSDLAGKRVAIVTNTTGADRELRGILELLDTAPRVVTAAILAPEHGAFANAEAGEGVSDARDPRRDIPVWSLYGKTRRPTDAMLAGVDVVLYDIQDVGARTYTYLSTLIEVLIAAAERGIEVWVLDRPNPVGADIVEGPVLESAERSFVGPHEVALRHGLTVGEFALLANRERGIGARLRVVAMEGYSRALPFEATGLSWVSPSPNIPTLDTAFVYSGMVLLEGTNLSEGRGTTRPFRMVGAPWIDGEALVLRLRAEGIPGARLQAARFRPSASKFSGEDCRGIELHVTDRRAFRAVATAVRLLCAVRDLHPGKLQFHRETFDRLAGTESLRAAIESGSDAESIVASWRSALETYLERRARVLLYP